MPVKKKNALKVVAIASLQRAGTGRRGKDKQNEMCFPWNQRKNGLSPEQLFWPLSVQDESCQILCRFLLVLERTEFS